MITVLCDLQSIVPATVLGVNLSRLLATVPARLFVLSTNHVFCVVPYNNERSRQ